MANPNFPSDGQAERVDALVKSDNSVAFKLGVGTVAPTGGTTPASWAGSATHSQGLPIGTNDGVSVIAGNDPSGNARSIGVDAGGGLQLSNYAQAPEGLTLTATTGTLAAATYYYRVSTTTPAGETLACTEVGLGVGASGGVILNWTQVPGATGYKVYGRSTGAELLMGTITNGTTTTFTDNGSVTPSGALPTLNTGIISIGDAIVSGPAAAGTALSGYPVLVAGSDATNVRTLLTDTSGRQQVVGASAVAAAVAGNPVLAGLSDGTNARYLLGDTSGRQIVVGASAVAAAVAGNPVLVGGTDGTNARYVLLDTSGHPLVAGAAASGSAVAGNPVLAGGSDGTNARSLQTNTAGQLVVTANQGVRATYVASVQGVAYTSATQILVIEAPAGSPVYISRLIIWQTGTDTTNAITNFTLIRTTTAGTGGTITPNPYDTADAAFGGIVRSAPTAGTAGVTLFNIPLDVPTAAANQPAVVLDFDGPHARKMPVIAAGTANGIALVAPATTGGASFGASIEFFV